MKSQGGPGDNRDASGVASININPLRKRQITGELYERDPKIHALIVELAELSRDELSERAAIRSRSDPLFVPSECLLYFLRASRYDNNEKWFEHLYKSLIARVLKSLPRAESSDGKTESHSREAIRDKVVGTFVDLLSTDRAGYVERLDFFEVRFDSALANLRRDAQAKVWREENRSRPLEYDENGELSLEVEEAAGSFNQISAANFDDPGYRSRLHAAIDALPAEQSRIVHLLLQDMQIDSQEPNTMTISKVLKRSEKTIRNQRNKAFEALRKAMSEGEVS